MTLVRPLVYLALVVTTIIPVASQERSISSSKRDPRLLDVLQKVVSSAGGTQAFARVKDVTESGEITFYWGEGVKGQVTIQTMGRNRFRMEAELPDGKCIWIAAHGEGSRRETTGEVRPLSSDSASNLDSLTFPIAQVVNVLSDPQSDISLVGIEARNDRSVYRLRVTSRVGDQPMPGMPVVKDLLVDALTFGILSIEDRPFQTYEVGGKPSDKPTRVIEFNDFRSIDGLRVPFSIDTKLMGQSTLSIRLTNVAFNSNLSPDIFKD